jgi:hypothetical protein
VLALTTLAIVSLIWRSCELAQQRSVETSATARVAGPAQTVFDWSSEACAPDELADLSVRAYRDYRGRVQLILPHYNSWRLSGPDLNHLHNPCRRVMSSSLEGPPSDFNQREWVASLYTDDGRRIAALVHEEYHGTQPGTCVQTDPSSCWYNAITFAHSDDGGRSFKQPPPPGQLVAASTYHYRPGVAPTGIFSPSNIVRARDGYYYALVVSRTPGGLTGSCLIRTGDPFEPSSWRAWDGSGFGIRFTDPYRSTPGAARPCAPIATFEIAGMHESLTYNTYLDRYLLVGLAALRAPGGKVVTGVYFSLSSDLIHWSRRKLIMEATSIHTFDCGGPDPIAYPSVIDPRSDSRTFATTGRRPYLYYTRFNYEGCQRTQNRDLVRRPIEFSE